MENDNLILIGGGGLGREIAAMVRNQSLFTTKGYYDDDPSTSERHFFSHLGNMKDLQSLEAGQQSIIAIGNPLIKAALAQKLSEMNFRYPVLLHPLCHIEDTETVTIGEGSIICSGSNITCHVNIGKHVLVNLNTTIGHDVVIGHCTSIMPGAHISGSVNIGNNVLVGTGAMILQNITIGDNAQVGAGAVVTKNVPPNATVTGIPARQIK